MTPCRRSIPTCIWRWGTASAVICISDPLREEAKEVISALRALGITSTVMLTGDSYRTAAAIAAQVGVDDFRAGSFRRTRRSMWHGSAGRDTPC